MFLYAFFFKATSHFCLLINFFIFLSLSILKMLMSCCAVSLQDVDSEGPEPSDWDKYASEEYEILVAEETANEQLHEGYI